MTPAKKAAKSVASAEATKRPKSNKTLSLDFHNFELLNQHCRLSDKKVSHVIDELIAAYLAEVAPTAD